MCLPKHRNGRHVRTIWPDIIQHTVTISLEENVGKLAGVRPELNVKLAFGTSLNKVHRETSCSL